jgi:hypothetical protein
MYSVAADKARNGTSGDSASRSGGSAPSVPSSGLARRVPGAQRPDVPLGGWEPPAPAAPSPTDEERTAPEDVYSFLSSFQSGVAKGRADAHAEPGADIDGGHEEDR